MEIAEALARLIEAKNAHDKALDGYDGGSWGWHGHHFIQAVHNAERHFEEALSRLIDERIREFVK